jgi:agmatinase
MNDRKRYQPVDAMVYPRFSGIRTFMRLPYVTELTSVDFAIVGVPFDTGGTYRVGARFGPEGIRSASALLRPYHPEHEIAIFEHCSGVDYGDLPVTPGYLPESHQQIQEGAETLFDSHAIPIFLGGDHSISLPLLRAAAARHGPVALIQFDSHGDVWHGYFGGKDTHGTPFRRAVEENLLDLSRSIQVGLRGSVYDAEDIQISHDLGFQVITATQLHETGIEEALQQIRARAGNGPAYLTFDIDFVDPAFAPGTGTPEVGGFTGLRGLVGIDFIGYDLVEVMPPYDPAGITSLLAANLIYEFIALEALRRRNRDALEARGLD